MRDQHEAALKKLKKCIDKKSLLDYKSEMRGGLPRLSPSPPKITVPVPNPGSLSLKIESSHGTGFISVGR